MLHTYITEIFLHNRRNFKPQKPIHPRYHMIYTGYKTEQNWSCSTLNSCKTFLKQQVLFSDWNPTRITDTKVYTVHMWQETVEARNKIISFGLAVCTPGTHLRTLAGIICDSGAASISDCQVFVEQGITNPKSKNHSVKRTDSFYAEQIWVDVVHVHVVMLGSQNCSWFTIK